MWWIEEDGQNDTIKRIWNIGNIIESCKRIRSWVIEGKRGYQEETRTVKDVWKAIRWKLEHRFWK